MVYEDTRIYNALFKAADEFVVERAQHFNPFFSWVAVTFTYFTIGIRGGDVWKYLFYCSTAGFLATALSISSTLSKKLDYETNIFSNFKYVEGYLWTLTEWGYTYINFIKIRSCIKSLRKPRWNIVMILILIYSLGIRTVLSYLDSNENTGIMTKEEFESKKDRYHGLVFFPLGIISIIFIFFIFKEFFEETDGKNKSIIYSLLHSTLTRMLFVSLIFIGLAIVVHIPRAHYFWYFIRMLLWRLKGDLGIIFLVDMLLLRIDLDHNQLIVQKNKIDQLNDKPSFPNHLTNEEINKLNFSDLNVQSSTHPLTSQNNDMEEYEPNELIQENVSAHSQTNSKIYFKHNLNLSQHSVNDKYNPIRNSRDNYESFNHNKSNEINTNILYSQHSQLSQHSQHSQHNQFKYNSLSNNTPLGSNILQSPVSSPTFSNSRLVISPSSTGMPYLSSVQKLPSSGRLSSNELILNKSSPSTNSINNSEIVFKPSNNSSNDDTIYTRPDKSPSRKHPGNIVLESTLQ